MRSAIGIRLREERERLELTQAAFAELGGASKRSQIEWEKGAATPNAEFLAFVAEHGVDVLYVLTGARQQTDQAGRKLELLNQAWVALEEHYQRTGRAPSPTKKRQAAEALYQLSLERGGLQGNQDMVAILASMAA